MLLRSHASVAFLLAALWLPHSSLAPPAEPPPFFETFEIAFPNLVFERPVALRPDPSGTNWLFVVEQGGTVRTFEGHDDASESYVVLDISQRVLGPDVDVESGLLGLALHPDFGENGFLYVYYLTDETGSPTARLSRFTASGSPQVADLESEVVLIELPRTDLKHNGGDVHFGPDGYLYVSFGDAMCCGDPAGHGQDRTNLFSSIIRIDVDAADGDLAYGIPSDNPFAGNAEGWREEIWAFGLRNPWRFSFHPETGEIWVGDVGELTFEEINRVVPGGNYGWSIMEGPDCFEWPPGSGHGTDCDTEGLELPSWSYGRDVGVSVTGGYFYRGDRRADLHGQYVFADWGTARIFAGTPDEAITVLDEVDLLFDGEWPLPSAFGEDNDGELYFLGYFGGRVYRFVHKEVSAPPDRYGERTQPHMELAGPNPFSGQTRLRINLPGRGDAVVEIFDMLGRRVATPLHEPGLAAGPVDVIVSGYGLASGAYIVRLIVDGAMVGSLQITLLE